MLKGLIEVLTPHFVHGWAECDDDVPALVIAECHGRLLGVARAEIDRPDLRQFPTRQAAFLIDFRDPLDEVDLEAVRVRRWNYADSLPIGMNAKIDDRNATQVFILGSPRSGTSELAATLAAELHLPWVGEGHVAAAFANAAQALAGDPASSDEMVRLMTMQSLPEMVSSAARSTYYLAHMSASFVDKTPGVEMIRAAPFLTGCFPEARYIFLRRNGISNVLSRQAKFGGGFDEHCQDWAEAMNSWERVRGGLPHFIEVEQEMMLSNPESVAVAVAGYLLRPAAAQGVAESLRKGSREKTGAGLGKTTLAQTGWSAAQIDRFRVYCGAAMCRWGYLID